MYYRDDTHYFVMTAKKESLLKKGVLKAVSVFAKLPRLRIYPDHACEYVLYCCSALYTYVQCLAAELCLLFLLLLR